MAFENVTCRKNVESVVTPEPEELEGEEKGVCGHSLQQELISVTTVTSVRHAYVRSLRACAFPYVEQCSIRTHAVQGGNILRQRPP